MPVEAYQTWSVQSRPDKRVRSVCERVGCPQWRNGWESTIDESTELGQRQAAFIRGSRRTFREQRNGAGLTVFRFESGQRCFADHQTMPELYLVRGGDYRAKVGEVRVHKRAEDWVEHVQQHMGHLLDERDKG
ncbi:hypothetical protein PV755_44475 [Streptomyces caniscabiei]|uniref:hypothetical protein n=1 Tax=Streptomyces caniscabiei TaxID=2746961 RepID=UPI0029A41092|nr:hypothetical protein [Streptomyces caniscabiei]MDX3515878.1 hypothetical protein [Streptomyces caniscabiei]MDX3725058.1 hypothetical protein [Streptomyces caniscabiei]